MGGWARGIGGLLGGLAGGWSQGKAEIEVEKARKQKEEFQKDYMEQNRLWRETMNRQAPVQSGTKSDGPRDEEAAPQPIKLKDGGRIMRTQAYVLHKGEIVIPAKLARKLTKRNSGRR